MLIVEADKAAWNIIILGCHADKGETRLVKRDGVMHFIVSDDLWIKSPWRKE